MEKEKLAKVKTCKKRNWKKKTILGKKKIRKIGKLGKGKLGKGKLSSIKENRKNEETWVNKKRVIILEILTFLKILLIFELYKYVCLCSTHATSAQILCLFWTKFIC